MPLFDTARGTRRELVIPQGTGWEDLDLAQRRHLELLAEQKLLFRHKGSLSHKRKQLIDADRQKLADAQYDDPKTDVPPDPEIATIEKEIEAVERRTVSLDDAIDRAESELVEVIEANREVWGDSVSPEVDVAYAQYAEQIEALEAARRQVSQKLSIYWWLRNFSPAEQKLASYKPSWSSYVPLKQENGEYHRFATVIEALRQDAVRPTPKDETSFIPWGREAYEATKRARTSS